MCWRIELAGHSRVGAAGLPQQRGAQQANRRQDEHEAVGAAETLGTVSFGWLLRLCLGSVHSRNVSEPRGR